MCTWVRDPGVALACISNSLTVAIVYCGLFSSFKEKFPKSLYYRRSFAAKQCPDTIYNKEATLDLQDQIKAWVVLRLEGNGKKDIQVDFNVGSLMSYLVSRKACARWGADHQQNHGPLVSELAMWEATKRILSLTARQHRSGDQINDPPPKPPRPNVVQSWLSGDSRSTHPVTQNGRNYTDGNSARVSTGRAAMV